MVLQPFWQISHSFLKISIIVHFVAYYTCKNIEKGKILSIVTIALYPRHENTIIVLMWIYLRFTVSPEDTPPPLGKTFAILKM